MASSIFTRNEITEIAKKILEAKPKILALNGPLGAGKTTLTKEIAKALGIKDNVISPTYVLETEYKIPDSSRLFIHIDCYRMESVSELINLGIEKRIAHGDLIIVEWADKFKSQIQNLKSQEVLWIKLDYTDNENERLICFETVTDSLSYPS